MAGRSFLAVITPLNLDLLVPTRWFTPAEVPRRVRSEAGDCGSCLGR
jgi:hypothetical protein